MGLAVSLLQIAVVAVVGLFIGAFLDRCIARLRLEKSLLWPLRRHCEVCYQPIGWLDCLPVLGYCISLGRCRACRSRVPARALVVELLTAGLLAALYALHVGGQGYWLPHEVPPGIPWHFSAPILTALFVYHALLICFLIVATFIDLDLMIIPDTVTVPGMLVGVLLGTFWYVELHPVTLGIPLNEVINMFPGGHWHMNWNRYLGLATGLTGLVVGGGVVWIVRAVCSWAFGREAMGLGDVTLMAMVGSFLGWQTVILAFFLAPLSAVVVGVIGWLVTRSDALPYGPHLSIASVLCVFWWRSLWRWAFQVFSFGPGQLLIGAMVLVGMLIAVAVGLQSVKRLFRGLTAESRA
jgi:leader peptidase (prepilin peptidase)/N-methyltransferase